MTDHIGPYRLVDRLGKGAMGIVYRAQDPSGRAVALKVMAHELSDNEELVERFRREASSAGKLPHPNITRIVDFGQADGQMFMAMELLEGSDLKDLIAAGQAGPFPRRLSLMVQASAGMAFVHAAGLVHRDIKPANLHVQPDGRLKIMDFGLVRLEESEMTRAGMVMGSPAYMAPELVRGSRADARSDVFALGAVFYELLSSQRAFPGRGLAEILMAVIGREPAPLAQVAPEAPAPVARIVERCLRKEPTLRYQTAGELFAALEVAANVYLAAPGGAHRP